MKKLLLVLLFVPLISFGQTKDEMELCTAYQTKSFYSNTEAENALDKILSVTGLKKNFTLTPCDGINNAIAISLKGERYILYDKNFMKNIGGSSSNIAILAHEIGHHLNNHARDITMYAGGVIEPDSKEVSRRQELEADEFAGFVMAKLDYSLEKAKQPFYKISNNDDDSYSTHPSRDKRLASITKGYNNGKIITKEVIVYVTKEKIVYVTKEKEDTGNETISGKRKGKYVPDNSNLSASEYSYRADNKSKAGDYYGAITDYSKAIELNPDYASAYTDRGLSKANLKDYYGAIADYSKAIELEPDYAWAILNRGYSKYNSKDYYGAIADFTKAIELNPDYASAYTMRGLSKDNLKDYHGAIADYSKAIELNPDYAVAYGYRGISKNDLGDLNGACADWRKAASLGNSTAAEWVRDQCN